MPDRTIAELLRDREEALAEAEAAQADRDAVFAELEQADLAVIDSLMRLEAVEQELDLRGRAEMRLLKAGWS